jgi:hypothetical protein
LDPTTAAITVGSGQIIFIVMQILKILIEKIVNPDDPLHDPLIQVSAMAVGVIGFLGHAWLIDTLTRGDAWDNVAQGALAGLAAVASYHILGSVKSASTPKNTGTTSNVVQPIIITPSGGSTTNA